MEFFYSGRGVASIVHWDCLVSIYLSIYIYGRFLCVAGFDGRVLLHSGLDMVIMRACT